MTGQPHGPQPHGPQPHGPQPHGPQPHGPQPQSPQADGRPAQERPLLHVVRGDPDDAELAALVAVLAARPGAAPAPAGDDCLRGWAHPQARLRRPLPDRGPGVWRRSGREAGVRTSARW